MRRIIIEGYTEKSEQAQQLSRAFEQKGWGIEKEIYKPKEERKGKGRFFRIIVQVPEKDFKKLLGTVEWSKIEGLKESGVILGFYDIETGRDLRPSTPKEQAEVDRRQRERTSTEAQDIPYKITS